jgi:dTDP-4-amino-4,6-dideoxygalactose transaminase
MRKLIPYGNHYFDKQDKNELVKSLDLKKVSSGANVEKFEKKIKKYLNTKYVLTTSSGTSALDLAFRILEIKKGDVVLMPAINFIAAFNTASLNNAKIYLVDVDKITGQMTPELVSEFIKKKK